MGANTKIEWTDHSWNPWTGCTKVSPGCDHCYAESWAKRSGAVTWGAGEPRRRTTPANWRLPLKWNAQAQAEGRRFRVFCSSLADVFDNAVPAQWRVDLFNLIVATPHLDWLLLTKRVGNVVGMVPVSWLSDPGWPAHVAIGATLVNQPEVDRDARKLVALPAPVRFISYEPALGPIDIRRYLGPQCDAGSVPHRFGGGTTCPACQGASRTGCSGISWVICGGESGPGARPMHIPWARSLMQQCKAAGVAFHMKQLGAQPRGWCVGQLHMAAEDRADVEDDFCDGYEAHEFGRGCGRCVLLADRKGGDMAEWPEDLRVREFPSA